MTTAVLEGGVSLVESQLQGNGTVFAPASQSASPTFLPAGHDHTTDAQMSPANDGDIWALKWKDFQGLRWYQLNPLTTLWHEMLFNIRPKFDAVKEALSVVALIDALLLTVVMSIPLNLSRSDLEEADAMFLDPTTDLGTWFTGKGGYQNLLVGVGAGGSLEEAFTTVSTMLAFLYTTAVCCLAASLVSIILCYTFGAVSNIEEDADRFRLWWFFARWIVLAEMCLTIVGVFVRAHACKLILNLLTRFSRACQYTFYAFNTLVQIKFAALPGQPRCYTLNAAGFVVNAPPGPGGPVHDDMDDYKLRCPADYNGFGQLTYLLAAACGTLGLLCIANIPLAALDAKRDARNPTSKKRVF
jgi:hypothetical protein